MKGLDYFLKCFLLVLLLSSGAFARGGGGCFLADTHINTDNGLKSIDTITVGDQIASFDNGNLTYDRVAAVYNTNASEYYEITAAASSVNVTAEHLFYTAVGELKRAYSLSVNDVLLVYAGESLKPVRIESIRKHEDPAIVYNILSDGKNNYVANDFLVHNKGCVLPDTPILTSNGEWKNIADIRVGDTVAAYTYNGELVNASVEEVYTLEAEGYYELEASGGYILKVTGEHPFYIGNQIFKTVDYLNPGDRIYVYDGKGLSEESIRSKRWIPESTRVYNLHTDWPNTYFANRVAVHNKGCFLPDTLIDTPDGPQKIDRIKAGDVVYGFDKEKNIVKTTVIETIELKESSYYEIGTAYSTVNATSEHPFYSINGSFTAIKDLKVGDIVYILANGELKPETISYKRLIDRNVNVINLHVNGPNTFFANGFAVHNKGGCFTAGTRILTPKGEKNIESLKDGDDVYAVTPQGSLQAVAVEEIYRISARVLKINTNNREVNTTAEHPFLTVDGSFRQAGELKVGDKVTVYDAGYQKTEEIISINETGESAVYNLNVGEPHTFVASGFIVHNKGGSSGGSSSPYTSSTPCGININQTFSGGRIIEGQQCIYVYYLKTSSSSALDSCVRQATNPWDTCISQASFASSKELQFKCKDSEKCKEITQITLSDGRIVKVIQPPGLIEQFLPVIFLFGFFGFFFLNIFLAGSRALKSFKNGFNSENTEDLDYCYPGSRIDKKAAKTAKVLEYLSKQDKVWEPVQLKNQARDVFMKLQKCWEARSYGEMKPLLMPYLYKQHLEQIYSLMRNHEIDRIENVNVNLVEIIQLRHYAKKNMQEFTAIIEASAKDYYVDDRNNEFLRGDTTPATFQEFWVFQRQDDSWLLREINQSRESNALSEENFVEELTPHQLENIYGESSKQGSGESAPWLEEEMAKKESKIHRMLNFLSKTDRGWDEENMKEIVRKTFVSVLTAFENRDASVLKDLVLPEAFKEYSDNVKEMLDTNKSVEYRNMCVRKVDIVLVKNYADRNMDEFTARVSAHAQTIRKEGGKLVSEEEYVTPFERYLTFRKEGGVWKLLKIQPPAKTKSILAEENVDEESSRDQIQWYYTQDRAV